MNKLYLAGGGSNSNLWSQMISDALNLKVIIPDGKEFGAKGAALLTLKAIYNFDINSEKNNKLKIKKEFLPNFKNHIKYKNIYLKYKTLSRKLYSDV